MRGAARAAALLLAVSACGESAKNHAAPDFGPVSIRMESEDAVDGRRPVLTLACGPAGASFWLELVRTPTEPPAGAHGTIKLDDGPPQRIGLVSLGEDKWAPGLDATRESELARAMLAARNVYFLGPEGTTERAYRWDMGRLGEGIEGLRLRCG